jgi:hypothetical protein
MRGSKKQHTTAFSSLKTLQVTPKAAINCSGEVCPAKAGKGK